jgi:hypothetical protein
MPGLLNQSYCASRRAFSARVRFVANLFWKGVALDAVFRQERQNVMLGIVAVVKMTWGAFAARLPPVSRP